MSSEQFREITQGGVDFENIYIEIQYFYKIRENCHLHVKINGECFTEHERERFIELFHGCSDTFNIDHVVNVWSGIQLTEEKTTMYDLETAQSEEKLVCPQMFYELMIHSNGDVSPCCVDYNYLSENLGNVKVNTLKEIWCGERLLQM